MIITSTTLSRRVQRKSNTVTVTATGQPWLVLTGKQPLSEIKATYVYPYHFYYSKLVKDQDVGTHDNRNPTSDNKCHVSENEGTVTRRVPLEYLEDAFPEDPSHRPNQKDDILYSK